MSRRLATALVAALLVGTVLTELKADQHLRPYKLEIFGSGGAISCGKWLQNRQSASWEQYVEPESWVLGFITGMNDAAGQLGFSEYSLNGSKTDAAGMFVWIDNYCRAHPLDKVVDAAERLWLTLSKSASK